MRASLSGSAIPGLRQKTVQSRSWGRTALQRLICGILVLIGCSRYRVNTSEVITLGAVESYVAWANEAGWRGVRTIRDDDFGTTPIFCWLGRADIFDCKAVRLPHEAYYPQVMLRADSSGSVVWIFASFLNQQRETMLSMFQRCFPQLQGTLRQVLDRLDKDDRPATVHKGVFIEVGRDAGSHVVDMAVAPASRIVKEGNAQWKPALLVVILALAVLVSCALIIRARIRQGEAS